MAKTIQANRLYNYKDEFDESEWLEMRKMGIGGSDIAAAIGMSPWKSQYELYLEKIGERTPKFSPEELERMETGRKIEKFIAEIFSERMPHLKVEKRNCIYQHKSVPWAICNLDRVCYDETTGRWGVVEIKNIGESTARYDDWKDGEFPFYYNCQVQHELFVTELEYAFLAVLIGGNKFRVFEIERDEELIQHMESNAADFWTRVEQKIEPPMDFSDSCYNCLKDKYKGDPELIRDLIPYVVDLNNLKIAQHAHNEAAKRLEHEKNNMRRILEDAEAGYLDGKKVVSWKSDKRGIRTFKTHF